MRPRTGHAGSGGASSLAPITFEKYPFGTKYSYVYSHYYYLVLVLYSKSSYVLPTRLGYMHPQVHDLSFYR